MEYRVLGSLEVLAASGEKLALGGAMQQSVLASLLLRAGQTVALERLIDDLWHEPPETAARTVQAHSPACATSSRRERSRAARGATGSYSMGQNSTWRRSSSGPGRGVRHLLPATTNERRVYSGRHCSFGAGLLWRASLRGRWAGRQRGLTSSG